MNRSLDTLVINPLFYDLLSGEFKPLSDEKGRTHSLARLATATFIKGDCEADKYTSDELVPVVYTPSWANRVNATASVSRETEGINKLHSIGLATDGGYNSLDIDIIYDYEAVGLDGLSVSITPEDDEDEEVHLLELGSGLNHLRTKISSLAHEVFTIASSIR